MGRRQTFDTDATVRAARAVFWERGYEGTPMSALQEATGLGPSSIYHAFGSKRGLFDAAVQSYLTEVVRPRLRGMLAADASPDAVVDYFTSLRQILSDPNSPANAHGCLLVNTASTPEVLDQTTNAAVADYRGELEHALSCGIRARYPRTGEHKRAHLTEVLLSLQISALALTRADNAAALRSVDAAIEQLTAR